MIVVLILAAFAACAYLDILTFELGAVLGVALAFSMAYYLGKAWAEDSMAAGKGSPVGGLLFATIFVGVIFTLCYTQGGEGVDDQMLIGGAAAILLAATMTLGASCAQPPKGFDPSRDIDPRDLP